MRQYKNKKIIVILGQTATGKSDLGVRLAKKFNGEIISADSRQVYKGLDIGTGKITKKEMRGIPHHMLDVASPKRQYTVAEYKKNAEKSLRHIVRNGKMPIIVGGTGFYIDTLFGDISLPGVPPNKKLRKRLEKKTTKKLFAILKKQDPQRAKTINKNNKVRLIRALEIVYALGKVPQVEKTESNYEILKIGIKVKDSELKEKIKKRLGVHIKQGMIAEVIRLHKKGLSWRRMNEFGLEYRFLARYLQEKITKQEMLKWLNTEIWQYARRQRTWFRRDKKIKWFSPHKRAHIEKTVKKFLQN